MLKVEDHLVQVEDQRRDVFRVLHRRKLQQPWLLPLGDDSVADPLEELPCDIVHVLESFSKLGNQAIDGLPHVVACCIRYAGAGDAKSDNLANVATPPWGARLPGPWRCLGLRGAEAPHSDAPKGAATTEHTKVRAQAPEGRAWRRWQPLKGRGQQGSVVSSRSPGGAPACQRSGGGAAEAPHRRHCRTAAPKTRRCPQPSSPPRDDA
mmetsp:Transcript_124353/g.277311  ORF Transcript_124353/g.277311 Transcript_124353/m.277311 type:complete len:208 (-) Transcript_124353:3-626(-)